MFAESTPYYDKIYQWKDYKGEAEKLRAFVAQYKTSDGNRLLDVACGTGGHFPFLREDFEIEGVDLNAEMLKMAEAASPGLRFHEQDMAALELDGTFDVILCLFSSIGYVGTDERLRATVAGFARHLRPGGVALVEPWFTPEQYRGDHVWMTTVDEPELKICRMNNSCIEEDRTVMVMHYLVGTPGDMRYLTERHELAMFRVEQFAAAAKAANLRHEHLEEGLSGRGLHVFRA